MKGHKVRAWAQHIGIAAGGFICITGTWVYFGRTTLNVEQLDARISTLGLIAVVAGTMTAGLAVFGETFKPKEQNTTSVVVEVETRTTTEVTHDEAHATVSRQQKARLLPRGIFAIMLALFTLVTAYQKDLLTKRAGDLREMAAKAEGNRLELEANARREKYNQQLAEIAERKEKNGERIGAQNEKLNRCDTELTASNLGLHEANKKLAAILKVTRDVPANVATDVREKFEQITKVVGDEPTIDQPKKGLFQFVAAQVSLCTQAVNELAIPKSQDTATKTIEGLLADSRLTSAFENICKRYGARPKETDTVGVGVGSIPDSGMDANALSGPTTEREQQ